MSEFCINLELHSSTQLMISIVDSTTEQASELSMTFQFNFHLNKQDVNSAYAPSSIYIAQQFLLYSYGQCISVCLL